MPATIALFILAVPVVGTAFERGRFRRSTRRPRPTSCASSLAGLTFAAVDHLLLINAFYAQQNTWVPSVIGVITVAINISALLIFRPGRSASAA